MFFMKKHMTQCHFHITSYLTELCGFGDFLGQSTLCDAYHKKRALH